MPMPLAILLLLLIQPPHLPSHPPSSPPHPPPPPSSPPLLLARASRGGLKEILHGAQQYYYKALLSSDDLSDLCKLDHATLLKLKKTDLPDPVPEPEAIADGAAAPPPLLDGIAAEAEGAGEEEGPGGVPPDAPIPHIVVPVVGHEQPVQCKVDGYKNVTVYFDSFTHASGRQRVFVHCRKHSNNCRRYFFVDNFVSRARAVSACMAWSAIAVDFPNVNQRLQHIAADPPDDLVDTFERLQFP
eukprot:9503780-Pyramimonas_sp.AAC.1